MRGCAALAVQRFWSRLVRQASILNTTQGRSHTVTATVTASLSFLTQEEQEEEKEEEEEELSALDNFPDSFI